MEYVSLNKSSHFFQDRPACTDKENSKNLLTIRHKKNVDDPQDTNDSDNEEDNAIDLETRSYKSTSVATLTSDFFTNSSLF